MPAPRATLAARDRSPVESPQPVEREWWPEQIAAEPLAVVRAHEHLGVEVPLVDACFASHRELHASVSTCGSLSSRCCPLRVEHRYGTCMCTPFGSGCVAGAVGGDSVSPYMRGNVGCGTIGQYADGCVRVGAS